MASDPVRDEYSGTETTGHEWDGIRELNTPLPRWWLWVFYATIVWSIAYWIVMPAWPLVSGYTKGVIGYSQRAVVARQVERTKASQGEFLKKIATLPVDAVRRDPELLQFALAGGRSAFAVNCSQCHGTGAAGSVGYPNLNDDDWLWGGTAEEIHASIRYGIRSGHDDERISAMPAFLTDEVLTRPQIDDVTEHVLSLTNRSEDPAAAKRGAPLFKEHCAACHRENGTGNKEFGAPNLTDAIWLFGGDRASIVETVSNARNGVMPAWEGRLSPEILKMLAVYVHSLGGGKE